MAVPPNAPGDPRAIPQATCAPVHASVTAPVVSSTLPSAISPAEIFGWCAFVHQIFTVHSPVFASYVSSSVRPARG
jgi:hypothetical protein